MPDPSRPDTFDSEAARTALLQSGLIFERHPYPCLIFQASDYRLIDVSESFQQLLEKDLKPLGGRTLIDLVPESSRDAALKTLGDLSSQSPRSRLSLTFERAASEATIALTLELSCLAPSGQAPCWFACARRQAPSRAATSHQTEAERIGLQQFQAFFEGAAVGAFQLDAEGRFIKVNQRYCDLVGYTRTEIMGRQLFDPSIYQSSEYDHPILERLLRGEIDRQEWESRCVCKDGKLVWIRLSAAIQFDEEGNVRTINGIAEDITEAKRVHSQSLFLNELRDTLLAKRDPIELIQTTLRALARHSQADAANFSEFRDSGKTLRVYHEFCDERANTIESHPSDAFGTPDSLETLLKGEPLFVQDVSRDERTAHLFEAYQKLHIKSFVCQPIVIPSGPLALLTLTSKTPRSWTSEEGALLRETGARLIPAVQRAQSEASLAESEERFRSTFENAAVGIAHLSPQGRWLRVNERLCELVDYPREELLTLSYGDITHPDDLERDDRQARRLLRGEIDNYSMDKRYLRRDGSYIWVSITVSLQRTTSGEPDFFIAIIRDIALRIRSEEALKQRERELIEAKRTAEAANRSKDEFLSVMSHELRTPLNPIIGFAQLLAAKSQEPFTVEAAQFTLHSAQRMLELVESILDFTRIGERDPNPHIETFALDHLLEEPRAYLTTTDTRSGQVRFANGAEKLDPIEEDDRLVGPLNSITQILMNLLANAVKHAHNAPIRIVAGLSERSAEGAAQLVIEVSDEGPGIPEEFRPQLFHPFTQVDSSLTRKHEGLGLGLAISRKLARQIGGEVGYRENRPKGSVFWLRAPVSVEKSAQESCVPPDTELKAETKLAKLKILIIEDNRDNAEYFAFVLRAVQAEPRHAASGREAIEICRSEAFDLAMIDISMKDMSGFDTLQALRQLPHFASRTLCIAVTAHASDEMRRSCLENGFDGYISKPVSPAKLEESIYQVLSNAR